MQIQVLRTLDWSKGQRGGCSGESIVTKRVCACRASEKLGTKLVLLSQFHYVR